MSENQKINSINNSINSSGNNINSNNSNNRDINYLFNSVWKNIYLKKKILDYCLYFKIFKDKIEFTTIYGFESYEYKEYLKSIIINFSYDLYKLPSSVDSVLLNRCCCINSSIPDTIKSFGSLFQIDYSLFALNTTLETLILDMVDIEIPSNTLPSSITHLSLNEYYHHLKKDVLPKGLKKLKIKGCLEVEKDALPHSLLNISLTKIDTAKIHSDLPNGLLKLVIFNGPDSEISNNTLVLPDSLNKLRIRCGKFNTTLPGSLKSFQLLTELPFNCKLPNSLEYVNITSSGIFRQQLPASIKSLGVMVDSFVARKNGPSILPNGLESLELKSRIGEGFISEIKVGQLNSNLKSLSFGSNGFHYNNGGVPLTLESIFPSTLTYLDLGNGFNLDIGQGVLPSGLRQLKLGKRFNRALDPKAIPFNLEHLSISNPQYTHQIRLNNTHTMVSCENFIDCYYQQFNEAPDQLYVLKLSSQFNEPLSTIPSLQNKINLEHLHLGSHFNRPIERHELPTQNNIKILELSLSFNQIINLEYFEKLETLIVNGSTPKLKTTIDNNNNYNFYNLKSIYTTNNSYFIKSLDSNFYKFIQQINNNK